MFQLQQKEVAIKEQEVQLKAQKGAADIQIRMAEQQRKSQKEAIDSAIATKRLQLDKEELTLEAQKDGLKLAKSTVESTDKLNLELLRLIDQQNKGQ